MKKLWRNLKWLLEFSTENFKWRFGDEKGDCKICSLTHTLHSKNQGPCETCSALKEEFLTFWEFYAFTVTCCSRKSAITKMTSTQNNSCKKITQTEHNLLQWRHIGWWKVPLYVPANKTVITKTLPPNNISLVSFEYDLVNYMHIK